MEGGERCAFSSWKYSYYFEFVPAKDENIKVCCTLCARNKPLSSFKNPTSNLKKHLESQHSTVKFTEPVPPGGESCTVDSPSFGAIINKSLATINAALGVTVKNALPIK